MNSATSPRFRIYNASAGSGKTFTLVREYLSILLASDHRDTFKQVLAITFTNKAVNEMKHRILENLAEFAEDQNEDQPSDLFKAVQKSLDLPTPVLKRRAKALLKYILHNYAFFDIVTIDKFTHGILRTFARDLDLPRHFEVVLETDAILKEAIDNLLYKAGDDALLTNALLQFSMDKADEDKSWDLSRDLFSISRLLVSENDLPYLQGLPAKSLEHFAPVLDDLKKQMEMLKKTLVGLAQDTLDQIAAEGLEHEEFNGGKRATIPGFFKKTAAGDMNYDLSGKWIGKLEDTPLYPKKFTRDIPAMERLHPVICDRVPLILEGKIRYRYLKALHKCFTPLSLLQEIRNEVEVIKKDRDLLLISEFNSRIATAIADQPAPFIYERIGERYSHYFIDEFQDTSGLQWSNLKPLVHHALSGESLSGKRGSLLIVGDAKQSIYRWRGGLAEQFIALYSKENKSPFDTEKYVENLPVNYRSLDEVITFNNHFFKHIAQFLSLKDYRELFEHHSSQETTGKKGGYIQFDFIPKEEEDPDEAQLNAALNVVEESLAQNYTYGDIAVLCRGNKHALKIAQHLAEAEIPVISSESLLLKNNKEVEFVINLIRYINRQDDKDSLSRVLWYLAKKEETADLHLFISSHLSDPETVFGGYDFSPEKFVQLPFYNAVEYAAERFQLYLTDHAYLQALLDQVHTFTQEDSGSISHFLEYWEARENKLSLPSPGHANAIQILTIHKSKGLEFPVVIFPFANSQIYGEKESKTWVPVNKEHYGVPYANLAVNSLLDDYDETTRAIYESYRQKQELDAFNILYVAFTRPVERLYVISGTKKLAKDLDQPKAFPDVFVHYLQTTGHWQEHQTRYSFGNPIRTTVPAEKTLPDEAAIPFMTNKGLDQQYRIATRSGSLWGTAVETSVSRGILYHELLSGIRHAHDKEEVIQKAILRGDLPEDEAEETAQYIEQVLTHPELSRFFSGDFEVYNEQDILTSAGELLRPDRVMVRNNAAWLLDYKTGEEDDSYRAQLDSYKNALQEMGYTVEASYLVYIREDIRVESYE